MTRRPLPAAAALLLSVALAAACGRQPRFAYDFEHDRDLDAFDWACRTLYRLSPEHATSGATSLEIGFHPAPAGIEDNYPGLSLKGFDPDWSAFQALRMDAHNGGPAALELRVRIDDRRNPAANDWFRRVLPLAPGDNLISLPLGGMRTDAGRALELRTVLRVTVYLANPREKRTVYLDRLRLE